MSPKGSIKSEYRAYDFTRKNRENSTTIKQEPLQTGNTSKYVHKKKNVQHHKPSKDNKPRVSHPHPQKPPICNHKKMSDDFHLQRYNRNNENSYPPNCQQQYNNQQELSYNNQYPSPNHHQGGDNNYTPMFANHGYNNCNRSCWYPQQAANMQYPYNQQYNTPNFQRNAHCYGHVPQQGGVETLRNEPPRDEWYAMKPQGILKINQPNKPQEIVLSRNYMAPQIHKREITINSDCLKETEEPQEVMIKDQYGIPQGVLKYNRRTVNKKPTTNSEVKKLEEVGQRENNIKNEMPSSVSQVNVTTSTADIEEEPATDELKPPVKKRTCSWRIERLSLPKNCVNCLCT